MPDTLLRQIDRGLMSWLPQGAMICGVSVEYEECYWRCPGRAPSTFYEIHFGPCLPHAHVQFQSHFMLDIQYQLQSLWSLRCSLSSSQRAVHVFCLHCFRPVTLVRRGFFGFGASKAAKHKRLACFARFHVAVALHTSLAPVTRQEGWSSQQKHAQAI